MKGHKSLLHMLNLQLESAQTHTQEHQWGPTLALVIWSGSKLLSLFIRYMKHFQVSKKKKFLYRAEFAYGGKNTLKQQRDKHKLLLSQNIIVTKWKSGRPNSVRVYQTVIQNLKWLNVGNTSWAGCVPDPLNEGALLSFQRWWLRAGGQTSPSAACCVICWIYFSAQNHQTRMNALWKTEEEELWLCCVLGRCILSCWCQDWIMDELVIILLTVEEWWDC